MSLPHRERHRWVEEISKINKKINKSGGGGGGGGGSAFGGSQLMGGFSLENPD